MYEKRRLKVEFLREYAAKSKRVLARESGAQRGLYDEKKPKVESLVTLPL
jgi:hypothetical protein